MSRATLVVALAGIVVLGVTLWLIFGGRGDGGDTFDKCIARVVLQSSETTKGLKLDLSSVLPRLPSHEGKDGEAPSLKLDASDTDKEIFRALTESQWTQYIKACENHFNSRLGPVNAEVQVWTRAGEQLLDDVYVRRVAQPGDHCNTHEGTCPLVLHAYAGAQEKVLAQLGEFSGEVDLGAAEIEQGTVKIQLSHSARHAIVLLDRDKPVVGRDVTVEDADADGKIVSGACADKGHAGVACLTAGTGSDGRQALFQIPQDRTSVAVSFQLANGTLQHCTARSMGTTFQVALEKDCSQTLTPICDLATTKAVANTLRSSAPVQGLQQPFVELTFEVSNHHLTKVKVQGDPTRDRARLSLAVLTQGAGSQKSYPAASCKGGLRWPLQ